MRFRESGNTVWIEFHLLFSKGTLLDDAHQSATEIETSLKKMLNTSVNVVTHLEPLERHDEIHKETHGSAK